MNRNKAFIILIFSIALVGKAADKTPLNEVNDFNKINKAAKVTEDDSNKKGKKESELYFEDEDRKSVV